MLNPTHSKISPGCDKVFDTSFFRYLTPVLILSLALPAPAFATTQEAEVVRPPLAEATTEEAEVVRPPLAEAMRQVGLEETGDRPDSPKAQLVLALQGVPATVASSGNRGQFPRGVFTSQAAIGLEEPGLKEEVRDVEKNLPDILGKTLGASDQKYVLLEADVLRRFFFDGDPHQKIAMDLEISVPHSRQLVYRGIGELAKRLAPYGVAREEIQEALKRIDEKRKKGLSENPTEGRALEEWFSEVLKWVQKDFRDKNPLPVPVIIRLGDPAAQRVIRRMGLVFPVRFLSSAAYATVAPVWEDRYGYVIRVTPEGTSFPFHGGRYLVATAGGAWLKSFPEDIPRGRSALGRLLEGYVVNLDQIESHRQLRINLAGDPKDSSKISWVPQIRVAELPISKQKIQLYLPKSFKDLEFVEWEIDTASLSHPVRRVFIKHPEEGRMLATVEVDTTDPKSPKVSILKHVPMDKGGPRGNAKESVPGTEGTGSRGESGAAGLEEQGILRIENGVLRGVNGQAAPAIKGIEDLPANAWLVRAAGGLEETHVIVVDSTLKAGTPHWMKPLAVLFLTLQEIEQAFREGSRLVSKEDLAIVNGENAATVEKIQVLMKANSNSPATVFLAIPRLFPNLEKSQAAALWTLASQMSEGLRVGYVGELVSEGQRYFVFA